MNKILENVEIDKNSGCWNWLKSLNSSGYGQLTVDGTYWSAHRYSVSLTTDLKTSDVVRHLCHNKRCCNPEHLAIGTHADNWRDSEKVHLEAARQRRRSWNVCGQNYKTLREACKNTGISNQAMIKYTKDGTFDVESYRIGCRKARVKPKV